MNNDLLFVLFLDKYILAVLLYEQFSSLFIYPSSKEKSKMETLQLEAIVITVIVIMLFFYSAYRYETAKNLLTKVVIQIIWFCAVVIAMYWIYENGTQAWNKFASMYGDFLK